MSTTWDDQVSTSRGGGSSPVRRECRTVSMIDCRVRSSRSRLTYPWLVRCAHERTAGLHSCLLCGRGLSSLGRGSWSAQIHSKSRLALTGVASLLCIPGTNVQPHGQRRRREDKPSNRDNRRAPRRTEILCRIPSRSVTHCLCAVSDDNFRSRTVLSKTAPQRVFTLSWLIASDADTVSLMRRSAYLMPGAGNLMRAPGHARRCEGCVGQPKCNRPGRQSTDFHAHQIQ